MVLSDCGHAAGAPSGVCDQSSRRMRSPISPPPARKSRLGRSALAATLAFLSCCDMRSPPALRGVRGTRSVNRILLQHCTPPRPAVRAMARVLCVAAFEHVAHLRQRRAVHEARRQEVPFNPPVYTSSAAQTDEMLAPSFGRQCRAGASIGRRNRTTGTSCFATMQVGCLQWMACNREQHRDCQPFFSQTRSGLCGPHG